MRKIPFPKHRGGADPRLVTKGRAHGGEAVQGARTGRRVGPWLASPLAVLAEIGLLLAIALAGAVLLLEGREVPVPGAVAERVERLAEAALQTEIDIGRVALTAEGGGLLELRAHDVRLLADDGTPRATLPLVRARLGLSSLVPPFSAPREVRVVGASLAILRRADGTLDLGSDVLSAIFSREPPRTPAEAAGRLRDALNRPAVATLDHLTLDALSLEIDDARSGRRWVVPDATLEVARSADAITVSAILEEAGRVSLRAVIPPQGPLDLQISALLRGVPAGDLASQVPALVWLSPLKADVSGALIAASGADGTLGRLDGTLEIGKGQFAPSAGSTLDIDRMQAYFTYRPETSRIAFSQLLVEAPAGSVEAEGHAYLHGPAGALPEAMTAQIALRRAELTDVPGLPAPVAITGGALDARLTFAPFTADIGQIALAAHAELPGAAEPAPRGSPEQDEIQLLGRGQVRASAEGFTSSFDLGVNTITPQRLFTLWPVQAVPRTRDWLSRNLLAGELTGLRAGLRTVPGARPQLALTFGFRDGRVRALRGWPPIEGGAGFASLAEDRFALTLEAGTITPPAGGAIDLAGASFLIPEMQQRPAVAEVRLQTESSVTAALSLIDQPPLGLMRRAGRSVALAEGRAALSGFLRFPMKKGIEPADLEYDISGRLSGLTSGTLVPNRQVSADALTLRAGPAGLAIEGMAQLDGVPLSLRYTQGFGAEGARPEVTGRAAVSQDAARALGVDLPEGALEGETGADFALSFPRDAAPRLSLSSDLAGLSLRLEPLGWSKPAATEGSFTLDGQLGRDGAPPRFETLALSAPGLDMRGSLTLAPGGGIDRLSLERVRVGGWLDAVADLVGRGAGRPPDISLRGGRMDLRRAPFGQGGGGGEAASGGGLSGQLDRLTLAEGFDLTGLRFDLERAGAGLTGALSGRVNGGAAISGTLAAGQGGRPRIDLTASDAGAVLASAGAFREAQGGALSLSLRPGQGTGQWTGALTVEGIRVTAAPGLAALLNAISVVGLLDQLNGPGLLFSTIRAAFRLTPDGLEITSASAVGPSLGVSAEGIYDTARDRIDLRGVLSPVYFVNAIGEIFTREGEGLFGMTYTVQGPAGAPEIRVNPLSVLTPGAFREIFRAPVPTLPGAEE